MTRARSNKARLASSDGVVIYDTGLTVEQLCLVLGAEDADDLVGIFSCTLASHHRFHEREDAAERCEMIASAIDLAIGRVWDADAEEYVPRT